MSCCNCDHDPWGTSACNVDYAACGNTAAIVPSGQAEVEQASQYARDALLGVLMLSSVSAAISAYHGYKRNEGNAGYALAWGFAGFVFPVIVPVVAVVQGYAEPHYAPVPPSR